MTRPAKRGQAAGASRRTSNRSRVAGGTGSSAGGVSLRATIAATSRATPSTDSTSPRFGVTLSVRIVSSRASASRSGVPGHELVRQLEDALVLLRQAEFARRAEHAVRLDAAQLRPAESRSPQPAARPRRRAAFSCQRARWARRRRPEAAAGPPPATWQTVSLSASGWRLDREHLADHDALEVAGGGLDRFDLEAAHGEARRESPPDRGRHRPIR